MGMEKMGQEKTTKESNKKRETSAEKKAQISEDAALGEIASDRIFEEDPELAKELAEDRKIQERAQEYKDKKEKQARKRKKNILIAVLIIAVAAAGGTAYYMEQKKASEVSLTDITITDSQELVYAEVTKVVGNDISVSVVQESSKSAAAGMSGAAPVDASGAAGSQEGQQAENGSSTAGSGGKSGMPSMQGGGPGNASGNGGSMPSMQGGQGNMPGAGGSMGAGSGMSGMPSMQNGAGNAAGSGASTAVTYEETGKTADYEIPVGTTVITKLGTEATFSSLSSGDVIAIALEKGTDDIDRIWIVQ